ncbi:MAG: TssA family type VI secretion system protein [Burkholderiaceae bacterium]|jgi:type VI secretion system protein VasJ|nr:TssA family type VI secretion system protein [Burkholderiaceae bacterium]
MTKTVSNNAGKVPITEIVPAGWAVREDQRFDDMQREIDTLTAISITPRRPDWNKVVNLADEILRTKGKDILVAAWMGAGLIQQNGVEGVGMGAEVLADLCEYYWDTMFPPIKRLRARFSAITWWQEQVDAWLSANEQIELQREVHDTLLQRVECLDKALEEKDTEGNLRLWGLLNRLRQLPLLPDPQENAAPSPDALQADAPSSSEAAATDTASHPEKPVADVSLPILDTTQSLSQIVVSSARLCLDAADAILAADTSDALSYTLRRVAIWGHLLRSPSSEGGRTLLPPPPGHILPGLSNLFGTGNFIKVVQTAESQVSTYLYWLDLSAFTARALTSLGESHAMALLSLEGQVSALLRKLPGVSGMAFDDGTPFANTETQNWLRMIHRTGGDAPAESFAINVDGLPPSQAMTALEEQLGKQGSARAQITLYSQMCQVAQRGEFWQLIPPLSESILRLVGEHRVEVFDPAFTVEMLFPVYQALRSLIARDAGNRSAQEQGRQVLACLCTLSPSRILPELSVTASPAAAEPTMAEPPTAGTAGSVSG